MIDRHPEYEKADLLTRMVEPERMFTFRVVWMDDAGKVHDSGLVMYPAGHARNKGADLKGILEHKFEVLSKLTVSGRLDGDKRAARELVERFSNVGRKSADEVWSMNDFALPLHGRFE